MSDIYEKFDTSLIRMFVYSKAIALEENLSKVTPTVLAASMLLSGPNIVTEILSEMSVDINVIIKKIKKLIDFQSSINKDSKITCCNIIFSQESKTLLKSAVKIKNDLQDTILRIEYLLMAMCSYKEFKDVFGLTNKEEIEKILKKIRGLNNDEKTDDSVGVGVGGKVVNKESKKKNIKDIVLGFCVDLTEEAAIGRFDPIIGRDNEIEQIITTLCRKKKNNPMLVGKPGVGKTAVVEGVAQRIVSKSVPKILLDSKVLLLSLSSVVADTQYRGQFEEKMSHIIKFFRENPNYICFIDEIHAMLGAGNAVGGLDAGNILKPALARGDIKCIGATTEEEYTKYFLKDGALERRFQKVYIEEPNTRETVKILLGIKDSIEKHHSCSISDEAIEYAVRYADNYVHDKHFPDKAIDLIDDACAKFVYKAGGEHIVINKEHIARVVSEQQRVPYEAVVNSDIDKVLKIDGLLKEKIVGQDNAIVNISRILKNVYVGIRDMSKPICTLLFAGSSGTGKTYTAEKLSELLFSNSESLIRINLTEYSEPHSVSKLIGSPPGYVGFGEQNQLTDRVVKRPHCLILLDEIDKAHPDVLKIFMQVFSRGSLTDSKGRDVSFKQAIIILTTNNGFNTACGGIGFAQNKDDSVIVRDKVVSTCKSMFGAEFINRISDFIIFNDFSHKDKIRIAKIMMEELSSKIKENSGMSITYESPVLDSIIELSKDFHGINANPIEEVVKRNTIPSIISDSIITSHNKKGNIHLVVSEDKKIVANLIEVKDK